MILLIWVITTILTIFSFLKNKDKTFEALLASIMSLKKLAPSILGMAVLVGLVLTIFPKDKLVLIFNHKGLYGFLLVSLIGALVTIPGPIAFPLAGALLQLGANQELLASFITTLTMVGIVSSPLEISYFGKRFTILRQGFSFIAAIMIGLLMRGLL
jgi:uncharacterized membrane protein YraQ (UPF0718 family)